jgi:hypothetical protein
MLVSRMTGMMWWCRAGCGKGDVRYEPKVIRRWWIIDGEIDELNKEPQVDEGSKCCPVAEY